MSSERSVVLPSDFNPWLEIWVRPRATIRRIVQTDPKRNVYLIAALYGYSQFLDQASTSALGDNLGLPGILGMGLIAGPLGGVVGLGIGTLVLGFVARRLGGVAERDDMTAALAWSQVPTIFALALWAIQIAIFGNDVFMSNSPRLEANPLWGLFFIPVAAASVIIVVWQFALTVATIGEVNRFSIWRSIATVLLPAVILFALVIACIAGPSLLG